MLPTVELTLGAKGSSAPVATLKAAMRFLVWPFTWVNEPPMYKVD